VIGSSLADVDAYATAAGAMGERAEQWLRAAGLAALLVDRTGAVTRLVAEPNG
jgi:thiamine biosynthesis lipoprotein ApbE